MTFIVKLHRSTREKALISILMGLGVLASAAAILKLVLSKAFAGAVRKDFLWYVADYVLLAWLEVYFSIIAASTPPLKSMFERVLRRCGFISRERSSHTTSFC